MDKVNDLIPYVGKNILLSLYDECSGYCRVVNADKTAAIVHWYSYSPCYSCGVYGRNVYEKEYSIRNESIAEVNECLLSTDKLQQLRIDCLKNEEYIFQRFEELN